MIDKYEILNNNFKYFLIIPYIFWLSLIVFYIFNSDLIKAGQLTDGIIYYGNDSSTYINDAKRLLNFDFSKLHTSKLSYIFLISLIFFFNFSLKTLVLLQLFTTIISSFCLYLISKKLFSRWVGLLCLFFFLTYAPMQIRNFFILTEILFVNLSIILIYLSFFKQNQKILIFLISLFVLFLRPQGFLIILSLFFTFIIFKKQNRIYDFVVKIILMQS